MPELDQRVTTLENDLKSFVRFIKFHEPRIREPNSYNDWHFKDAEKHSELIRWTELDKRSSEYAKAKVIALEMMLNAMYANSRLLDKDHYYEGNVLDLFSEETVGIEIQRLHMLWKKEAKVRENLEKCYIENKIPNSVNIQVSDIPFINNDKLRDFLGMDVQTFQKAIEQFDMKKSQKKG